ncbi:Hypothetical predicted protein, partial [Mytilus galloprovincialis]
EKSHEEEIPEESDTVSIDSSLSSRSSVSSQSRFRSAKAKRLIAELKLRKLSEQHELERAQIEIKFRQQVFNHYPRWKRPISKNQCGKKQWKKTQIITVES